MVMHFPTLERMLAASNMLTMGDGMAEIRIYLFLNTTPLQFYSNLFETLQVFCSWSEDVHVI